jgi:hypothetical protein
LVLAPGRGPFIPFVFGDELPLPFVQPASSLPKRLSLPLCPFAPLPRAGTQSDDGPIPVKLPCQVPPPMALPFALLARKRVSPCEYV